MNDLTDRLLAFAATLANDEEDLLVEAAKRIRELEQPIGMLLFCPRCGAQHVDAQAGVVVEDSGCTVNGAASEFCRIF